MDEQSIEQDAVIDAQAFMDLAEANVSPLADEDAWETELGFLHDETAKERDASLDSVISEAMMLG